MFGLVLSLLAGYALLVGLLYIFQRQLIYHPDKKIGPLSEYGLEGFFEDFIKTSDGKSLQTWYRPAERGFPTVMYCHGNAYNLGNRAHMYAALAKKKFGVLAISYRGYGKSSGHPSEAGLYNDARAGLNYLIQKQHIPVQQIIVFGESLGTGVATQIATEFEIGALVLQSPYTAVSARAAEIHYYVPVRWLIKDRFVTIDKIGKVKAPVLIFHGELDETIPIAHGKTVFDTVTSQKQAFYFPDKAHFDFDSDVLADKVLQFAEAHQLIK